MARRSFFCRPRDCEWLHPCMPHAANTRCVHTPRARGVRHPHTAHATSAWCALHPQHLRAPTECHVPSTRCTQRPHTLYGTFMCCTLRTEYVLHALLLHIARIAPLNRSLFFGTPLCYHTNRLLSIAVAPCHRRCAWPAITATLRFETMAKVVHVEPQ